MFIFVMYQIRALGRNTRGSVAMRLKAGDKMASVDIIPAAMWKDLEKVSEAPDSTYVFENIMSFFLAVFIHHVLASSWS